MNSVQRNYLPNLFNEKKNTGELPIIYQNKILFRRQTTGKLADFCKVGRFL